MSAEKKIKILNIAFSSTYISHYTEHAIFFFLVCQISGLFHIYFVYHITIFFVSQDTCITMKLILNTSQSITILYSPHAAYTCIHWHYGLSVLACLVQQYLLVRTLYLGHNWGFTKILYFICCSSGYHFTDFYQMFFQLSTKKVQMCSLFRIVFMFMCLF